MRFRRHARSTAALVMIAGTLFGPSPSAAHADTAPPPAGDSCVVTYGSTGRTTVIGVGYEIPYPNLAGGPYVETEINAIPKSRAFASNAHEGFVGEVLLGTSGFYPENPTQAAAFWPAVEGETSTAEKDHGPLAHSFAAADEGPKAMAWAASGGSRLSPDLSIGQSRSSSQVAFDGKVVNGLDEAWGYDLRIGAASIASLHSVVEYTTDGTGAGTKATWSLEFLGVRSAKDELAGASGQGFSFQGGESHPGDAQRQAFNSTARAFADALETAGAGRLEVSIDPGSVNVKAGSLDVHGSGLVVRLAPKKTQGTTLTAASVIFGHQDRQANVELGACPTTAGGE